MENLQHVGLIDHSVSNAGAPGSSPAAAAFHASAAAKATVTGKAHVLLPSVAMLFLPVVVSIRAVS